MEWDHRRYNSLDFEMKRLTGRKMIKLSIDGGFSCPNRIGGEGCIFCSGQGSGEFSGDNHLKSGDDSGDHVPSGPYGLRPLVTTIAGQIAAQKSLLAEKWISRKSFDPFYVAYFQSFTSTFAPVEYLKLTYGEALCDPTIGGIAIGTRPDCISDETGEYLAELSRTREVWVELGIQTFDEELAGFINRGYPNSTIESAVRLLNKWGIRFVFHLIAGIPGDSPGNFLRSIDEVNRLAPWGIKIHMLNVLEGTALARLYAEKPFGMMAMDEYVSLVCDSLELLDPGITIHRLTGDGDRRLLVAPLWIKDKKRVLNSIDKEMRERGSYQGREFRRVSSS